MNALQKEFNQNIIISNQQEISRLQREMQNPRIRNVKSRQAAIEALEVQINQAKAALDA